MTNADSVFRFDDYKDFLRAWLDAGPTGGMTRLAEAAGCQRSYLSDVLRTNIHLTPDHAFGVAEYLSLSAREADYFLTLVHYARAGSKAYRARLLGVIRAERQEYQRLTKRLGEHEAQVEEPADAGRYYTSWLYGAVHVATSIDRLDAAAPIARRFGVSDEVIEKVLQDLESQGYVVRNGKRYRYNARRPPMHLADSSVFSRMNHGNWRALAQSRPPNQSSDVQYSSVFTVERKGFESLREQLLDFIQAQRQVIAASGSEEVAYFGCDLFVV